MFWLLDTELTLAKTTTVKNSLGCKWGDQGYIGLSATKHVRYLPEPSFPTGAKAANGTGPSSAHPQVSGLSPGPSPGPSPPGKTHYGDPFDGACERTRSMLL